MFRFTLRDLFWLTLLLAISFAIGACWWLDRQRLGTIASQYMVASFEFERLVLSLGATIEFTGDGIPTAIHLDKQQETQSP